DAPERVPEDERAPVHVVRPGEPRAHDAEAGDPPRQEHGLRAVALEERLALREEPAPARLPATGAREEVPAGPAPQHVPDVVADDRAERRDGDHHLDREA